MGDCNFAKTRGTRKGNLMEVTDAVVQIIVAAVGLISVLVTVVGPVVRKWLELWFEKRYAELEMQLPDNVLNVLREVAKIAVMVVEATNLEGESKDKLKQAEEIAEAWLLQMGYVVELDRIREAIEYVLFELKAEGRM